MDPGENDHLTSVQVGAIRMVTMRLYWMHKGRTFCFSFIYQKNRWVIVGGSKTTGGSWMSWLAAIFFI